MYSNIEYELIERRNNGYVHTNNGVLIQFVKNPTIEMAKIAVSHYGSAIQYIKPELQTTEVCMTAIKNYLPSIRQVSNKSVEFWREAFSYEPDAIKYIDINVQTKEMVLEAVKACGGCLQFIHPNLRTTEVCCIAVEDRPDMLACVPFDLQTQVYSLLTDQTRIQIPEVYCRYSIYMTHKLNSLLLHDSNLQIREKMFKLGCTDSE